MSLPGRLDRREVRGKPKLRSPAHRKWVREHHCVVKGCPNLNIDCCHLGGAAIRGAGIKASDAYTFAGCHPHHMEQHQIGERAFEKKYKLNLKALCREFYERSPHRRKLDNPYA